MDHIATFCQKKPSLLPDYTVCYLGDSKALAVFLNESIIAYVVGNASATLACFVSPFFHRIVSVVEIKDGMNLIKVITIAFHDMQKMVCELS